MVRALDAVALHRTANSLVRGSDPPTRELLKTMRMPRTYVVGDASDQVIPPDPELVASGVRWATVPDTGHAMGLQNPHGFAQHVADALAEAEHPS